MRLIASLGVATLLAQTIPVISAQDVARAAGETGTVGPVGASSDGETERVLALSSDVAYGEYLAGECASCHAADPADRRVDGAVPIIHGAEASLIARALLEYRAGIRPNATMGNIAGALNDEEIAVLSHYLASSSQASE